MQKISTMRVSGKNIFQGQLTIGSDLGDRSSAYCVLNEAGEKLADRSRIGAGLEALHLPLKDDWTIKNAVALGKSLDASTIVLSSYGFAENGMGVTLAAFRVSESMLSKARQPNGIIEGVRKKHATPMKRPKKIPVTKPAAHGIRFHRRRKLL